MLQIGCKIPDMADNERVYYQVARMCNRGEGVKGGAAMRVDEEFAKNGCPVANTKVTGSVEADAAYQTLDEIESGIRLEVITNIDGWCPDPCGLCKAKANFSSVTVETSDFPFTE